jgi:hypothetical protein
VVHDRRDGEDPTQPFVQTFLGCGLLGLCVRVIRSANKPTGAAVNTSPKLNARKLESKIAIARRFDSAIG